MSRIASVLRLLPIALVSITIGQAQSDVQRNFLAATAHWFDTSNPLVVIFIRTDSTKPFIEICTRSLHEALSIELAATTSSSKDLENVVDATLKSKSTSRQFTFNNLLSVVALHADPCTPQQLREAGAVIDSEHVMERIQHYLITRKAVDSILTHYHQSERQRLLRDFLETYSSIRRLTQIDSLLLSKLSDPYTDDSRPVDAALDPNSYHLISAWHSVVQTLLERNKELTSHLEQEKRECFDNYIQRLGPPFRHVLFNRGIATASNCENGDPLIVEAVEDRRFGWMFD